MAISVVQRRFGSSTTTSVTAASWTTPTAGNVLVAHVYNHDGSAPTITGWTRITNGREYEFDAEGRLLPEGRDGRAVEVNLSRDAATGRLLFSPK